MSATISRFPAAHPSTTPTDPAAGRPAPRAPFWLTDQQLSVQDRNRALARYSRSCRSLMG